MKRLYRLALLITLAMLGSAAAISVSASESDLANVTFAKQSRLAEIPGYLAEYLDTDYSDERGSFEILYKSDLNIGVRYVTERVTRISRFQTAEAIGSDGNANIYLDADSAKLTIEHALVLLPDGVVHAADPSTIQIVDDNEDRVFSDDQTVVIPWPALEPGATVILQYERKVDTSEWVVPWSRTIYPRGLNYLNRIELQASWQHEDEDINWSSSDPAFGCELAAPGRLTCAADKVIAFQTDDHVNYYDRMPQITLARQTSWEEISDRVRGFVFTAMSGSAEIVAKTRDITKSEMTEREKLSAIHEFVARDVRYVGLEHGHYSHVPRPSSITLLRRYGDCKDKTTLLLDMLRSADIVAYPVLVSTRRDDPANLVVPATGYFNHLIACGELDDDERFCLDATDAYTPAFDLSSSIQGAVALRLETDRSGAPEALPKDQFRWALDEDLQMHLNADGKLLESLKLTYDGPYGSYIRGTLAGLPPDERIEWVGDDYSSVVSDRVTPQFQIAGVDSLSNELSVQSDVTYEDVAPLDADLSYVEDAAWLDRMLGFFTTKNEHYDYNFAGMRYHGVVQFEIDPKWKLDRTGPELAFENQFGSLIRTHKVEGQVVTITTDVKLPERTVALEDIPSFNRFIRRLKQHNHFRVYGQLRNTGG